MLRDKFIHYFQQWRERQLRSPREKGMLLAAVVFLFSVGYYVLIWQPLSERIEQQETMLQQLVAMNTRLRSAAPDIMAARKSATTTPAQVSRVISDSASAHSAAGVWTGVKYQEISINKITLVNVARVIPPDFIS